MRRVALAVIGAGPAGCAAAVQAARLGVRPWLLDREGRAGGLIENARHVENYPGLEAPVSGTVFARRLGEHLHRFGLEVEQGELTALGAGPGGKAGPSAPATVFRLTGSFGEVEARAVILAVGTGPRHLGVPGEAALAGRTLFYEVKHLLPKPPERVLVVGAGEAAFDYALSLAGAGARVKVLMRSDRPAARGRLVEQVGEDRRILLTRVAEVQAVVSEGEGVAVTVRSPSGPKVLKGGALLVAVGRTSAAEGLAGGAAGGGFFVVGDARRGALGQAGMAVGDGLEAAARAVEHLASEAVC